MGVALLLLYGQLAENSEKLHDILQIWIGGGRLRTAGSEISSHLELHFLKRKGAVACIMLFM